MLLPPKKALPLLCQSLAFTGYHVAISRPKHCRKKLWQTMDDTDQKLLPRPRHLRIRPSNKCSISCCICRDSTCNSSFKSPEDTGSAPFVQLPRQSNFFSCIRRYITLDYIKFRNYGPLSVHNTYINPIHGKCTQKTC